MEPKKLTPFLCDGDVAHHCSVCVQTHLYSVALLDEPADFWTAACLGLGENHPVCFLGAASFAGVASLVLVLEKRAVTGDWADVRMLYPNCL